LKTFRSVAILQPFYIPWIGVFRQIYLSDVFVALDHVQFVPKSFITRNRIGTNRDEKWLSVPCEGSRNQAIREVVISKEGSWQEKHHARIRHSLGKAPHYNEIEPFLNSLYLAQEWNHLSEMNQWALRELSELLGISVEWENSHHLAATGSRDGSLILDICAKIGAETVINGPKSLDYVNLDLLKKGGVRQETVDYQFSHPLYKQHNDIFSNSIIQPIAMFGSERVMEVIKQGHLEKSNSAYES
jgi:hypothetical protein